MNIVFSEEFTDFHLLAPLKLACHLHLNEDTQVRSQVRKLQSHQEERMKRADYQRIRENAKLLANTFLKGIHSS